MRAGGVPRVDQRHDARGDLVRFGDAIARAQHSQRIAGRHRARGVGVDHAAHHREDLRGQRARRKRYRRDGAPEDPFGPRAGERLRRRVEIAGDRDAVERVAEERAQEAQRRGREIVRVVDERDAQPLAKPASDRRMVFQQPRRFGQRVACGQAAAPHELVDVRAVQPREDLREIQLAAALAVQLRRADGERRAVLVLRRGQQCRRREVGRVGVERRRAALRDGQKRRVVDPGVAQLTDQPQRRIGEARGRAQPGDLRVDVRAEPVAPLRGEQRRRGALEDLFRVERVDQLEIEREPGLQRVGAQQLERERVERRAAHVDPARIGNARGERARAVVARGGDDRGFSERGIDSDQRGETPHERLGLAARRRAGEREQTVLGG